MMNDSVRVDAQGVLGDLNLIVPTLCVFGTASGRQKIRVGSEQAWAEGERAVEVQLFQRSSSANASSSLPWSP